MATDQQKPTDDATSRVTAAALSAAKEIINKGGTQSEAAAAAKQVATNMLLKSKKKESDSSTTGGSDKSGNDSNTSSSPSDKSGGKQNGVGSDKASLATPPKDTPKSKTSMSTKNKAGKVVVESTSKTKATVVTTTTANATVSTASNSNAGSRLLNKFRKKKSSNDKAKKQKKKKKSKKISSKQKPATENKETTTTARSKVKTVPEEEESRDNKEDRVLTYSPNNEQQTQEVISQVSKSLNKSKVGLTTAAKSAIQSIRNKSPTLPTQSKSKHTKKKRHPDYHPNHTTKQKHHRSHHRRRTSSSVGSLTNSSGGSRSSGTSSSSYSSSYYYDTNTESLDSYEIEMLYNQKNIPAILESASSNASSYAQLRGKADQSNNDARGKSVESEDRYSPSIMSMYGLLDAVDDVLFPQNDDVDKKSKKKKDIKKDTPKKEKKDTPIKKKDTTIKSKDVDNSPKEKTKEKNSKVTTEKKENDKKVVIEKTPDKEPSEFSWFWKLCGATQLLNCAETSIKTDDCSSTFQESQGSTTLDDYSSNKEESIISLDETDNTTKSGTAVSTIKGKEVSSTSTTSNEEKTRKAVTAEMLLQEVKNEKKEEKVQTNDADDSTLDSSLLKAIGRGVMRDARKNSSSNKSTTARKVVVEEEESSLVMGNEMNAQVNTNDGNSDKKVVPAASNENESVSSKMKTMFRNTMGRCSVNPQYCNSTRQDLDNSLHYPEQPSQPQPAVALDDNPNWRDLVEDTVQTKQTAPAHTVVREQSNVSQQQMVAQGQGYQATSDYQASPPSTSYPSQHVQVGHFQTSVQPQQQHQFSSQQVGGYQGNNQVVQGGYQSSPSVQMSSRLQAASPSQRGVEQVWQPNYQVKPPVKVYSPSVPKVNSNFSVESMDEREDRYAGMEPQEEERREDPIMMGTAQPLSSAVLYRNNIPEQRQQYQQQRIVQQTNGATRMIRQDYNAGGQQVPFNAQHTRPLMMSNGNQPPQSQQQHQYRPRQPVVQMASLPQTRPQLNSMLPPNNQRQQQQYHKQQPPPQQQQPPASFHHIVDPNPSSVGYYEQANPQPVSPQAYHGGYRTFAA